MFPPHAREPLVAGTALPRPQGGNEMFLERILWFCPVASGLAPLSSKGSQGPVPCLPQGTGEEPKTGLWGVAQAYSPKVPGELLLFVFMSCLVLNPAAN